ncbi:MAG: hypothetical protein CMI67_25565 [Pelagibaca sp.]|nr:hypothetical protein [Pelagibaca sp.]
MTYGEIDTSNPQSVLLVSDFKKYETAKAYLLSCKALTKSDLLNAHDILLRGSTHAGKFRTIQNWLGKRKESAVYVPPPHENINRLIDEFLRCLNSSLTPLSPSKIIELYCSFLSIHPFLDGNGRLSRLLLEYMQSKSSSKIHFSLYRLGIRTRIYQDAVNSVSIKKMDAKELQYWNSMLAWSELLEHKQQELLHGFQRNIQAKLALCPLQKNDLLVIQLLLHQPVIVLEMLQNKLGISRRESSESLLRLTAVGILTEYKTRQNERQRIFVCMPVVELINKLDENLFLDK